MSRTPAFFAEPAQLTKTSTLPNSSSVALAAASTCSESVTSH